MKPIYITQIGFSTLKDQKKCQGFFFFFGGCEGRTSALTLFIYTCVFYRRMSIKRPCANIAYRF